MSTLSRMHRRTIGTLALWSPGLGHWLRCPTPMETKFHALSPDTPPGDLFILLPGIQDLPLDFELAGFIEEADRRGLNADMLAVDAHIGYYVRELILERLREDIVLPCQGDGYRSIWLVGASLGGLGSALYAGHFENDITGVFLMAPYLGQPALVREIERFGGPEDWRPSSSTPPFLTLLWKWLARYFKAPARDPKLYLGFGVHDKFAYANRFLAEVLPDSQVLTAPGGHNWPTWRQLWSQFLERFPSRG